MNSVPSLLKKLDEFENFMFREMKDGTQFIPTRSADGVELGNAATKIILGIGDARRVLERHERPASTHQQPQPVVPSSVNNPVGGIGGQVGVVDNSQNPEEDEVVEGEEEKNHHHNRNAQ